MNQDKNTHKITATFHYSRNRTHDIFLSDKAIIEQLPFGKNQPYTTHILNKVLLENLTSRTGSTVTNIEELEIATLQFHYNDILIRTLEFPMYHMEQSESSNYNLLRTIQAKVEFKNGREHTLYIHASDHDKILSDNEQDVRDTWKAIMLKVIKKRNVEGNVNELFEDLKIANLTPEVRFQVVVKAKVTHSLNCVIDEIQTVELPSIVFGQREYPKLKQFPGEELTIS